MVQRISFFIYTSIIVSLLATTVYANGGFFMSNFKDGPVTICSDSVTYDQNAGTAIYRGNVVVMQIKGVDLLCRANANAEIGFHAPLYNKHHATLWSDTHLSGYMNASNSELKQAKKICSEFGTCRYISGQKLIISMDNKSNAVKKVTMTIDDKKNLARYYSLTAKKGDTSSKSNYGEGRKLQFVPKDNTLFAIGNASIIRDGNTFRGDKIQYNLKTKIVDVPESSQGRSTIIIDNNTVGK
jgi:lipopolysaccharide transport protein LptA